MVLNVPLIGVWVKLLQVPYRYLFPSALFFIAVGVFSTQNSLFQIWEVLAFGVIGAVLMTLEFSVAPILLGFVLGPMVEENFRRALLRARPDGVRPAADQCLVHRRQRLADPAAGLGLPASWQGQGQARSRVRGLKRFGRRRPGGLFRRAV